MFARWAFSVLVGIFAATAVTAAPSAEQAALVEALDGALKEEDGRNLVEPYLENLKSLDAQVMEKVVLRQWWTLAREIVTKSHTQQVDLSFAVRKAVRALKDEADELLRTLNPKYGQAQQVSPSFQWAQNDTCIFLTVKYTVRWNAPGALEVTEPSVNMTDNGFNFSGLGKHSNNKYRYTLSLRLFDNIVSSFSSWSAASVGKLSVTLRKKWPRKWPRLLADKKLKINNMHVWMEMQDKLDSTLGGLISVSNSPVTCAASGKLYCLGTDTCKKPMNCTQCPGKNSPQLEAHLCAGMPTEKGSLTFKDADMDSNEIGGEVKIIKARNDFDIDAYVVYFGKDDKTKLTDDKGSAIEIGKFMGHTGDAAVKIPFDTVIPEFATHLLVFSKNEFGEYDNPGSQIITDAVLPKDKPVSITFEDEDGDKGYVSGRVQIEVPEDQTLIDHYSLFWGRSATRKISSGAHLKDVPKASAKSKVASHFLPKNTKIPDGATHLIAYSKNDHGEHPSGVSTLVVDGVKPCINKTDANCPLGVDVVNTGGGVEGEKTPIQLAIGRAKDEAIVDSYSLYWGRRDCSENGQTGAKNGHIQDVKVSDAMTIALPAETVVPGSTKYILVFSKNKLGESNFCAAAKFLQEAGEKKEL